MQNPTTGLTDISNLPADRVKPTEGKFEQSGSQSSTMQSVDHSNENVREQMPEGSLEHLTTEPGLIAQGVEAVKEFAHKAVEKIEEFVNATADMIHDMGKSADVKDAKLKGEELKEGALKRAYLVRRTISRKLGKRTEKAEKKAGLATGIAKVYAKQEYKNLRRKAARYGKELNRDSGLIKRSLKEEGKSLEGKARRFQADFSRDGSVFGAQLREGARQLRSQARRLLNDLPRQAESKPTGDFSEASPSKFLLEFSSNEMNGRTGKVRSQPIKQSGFEGDFSGKPTQWNMEVSAHDWNESVSTVNKYIGFLNDKANDFLKRASRQSHVAQRRFNRQSRDLKRTVQRTADNLLEKGKTSL